jgi:hypothetical protein
MQKHERELRKIAKAIGASLERTNGGHFRLAGEGWMVFTSSTPSDRRGMQNVKRDIRSAQRCAA